MLNRSATGEATRIYEFITKNHALFHLQRKENLMNLIADLQKIRNLDIRIKLMSITGNIDGLRMLSYHYF